MDYKVMITVPCYENIFPDTFKCIWKLGQQAQGQYEVDFDFVRGYTVDRARCNCVDRAMEEDATHLLFVDNDMIFEPDYLDLLLEHDLDVVMGYYRHRPSDPNDTVMRTNLCKLGQQHYLEQITPEEMMAARGEGYELVQVKGGGLGFCLINMDVFARIKRPWFLFVNYWTGHALSEDLFFSEQCAEAGIDIYADTRCYCGHIFRETKGGWDND